MAARLLRFQQARTIVNSAYALCAQLEGRQVQNSASPASTEPFYIFKSPTVVTRSAELLRSLGNLYSKALYRMMVEKEYNNERFLRGAKKAIALCALYLRENRYDLLPKVMNNVTIDTLKRRLDEIQPLAVDKLNFTQENIRHAFIHSSTISPDASLTEKLDAEYTFYATVVGLIDRTSTEPAKSGAVLLREVDDLLICNITLARRMNSDARWRITDVNFFEKRFLYEY